MTRYKPPILTILVFLWFVFGIGAYFVIHKPFSFNLLVNLGLAFWQILVAIVIIAISGGFGVRLLPWLEVRPSVRLSLQSALGLGILSNFVFILGVTIGFSRGLFIGLIFLLGLLLRHDIFEWLRSWQDLLRILKTCGKFEKFLASGTGLMLISTLIIALSPPIKFDSLVYHLLLPRAYIEAGQISFISWNMFWGMPQLGETLYTLAMELAGNQGATVLGWIVGLLTLVGLLGYLTQRINTQAGWASLAALVSGFTLSMSIAWGYVGWWSMLYSFCMLVSLDLWRSKGENRYLLIAGIYSGLALSTKYTAGVVVLGGFVIVVLETIFRRNWEGNSTLISNSNSDRSGWILYLSPSFQFASITSLIFLPWMLKNFLNTGNPFYPLLFPAGQMSELRIQLYQNHPAWGNLGEAILLPWQATVTGLEGAPGFNASIGPILLCFGVLFWLDWNDQNRVQRILLETSITITIVGLFLWGILSQISGLLIQTRLYLSVFPALSILVAFGFDGLKRVQWFGVRMERIGRVIIILVFGFSLIEVGIFTVRSGAMQVLLGLKSEDYYMSENLGMYAIAMDVVNELPKDSRVLMLWEPRSLYCYPKCNPDEVLDRWLVDRDKYRDPIIILKSWRELGYTHLLFHKVGADFYSVDNRYTAEDWRTLRVLLDSIPVHADLDQIYMLYSLVP